MGSKGSKGAGARAAPTAKAPPPPEDKGKAKADAARMPPPSTPHAPAVRHGEVQGTGANEAGDFVQAATLEDSNIALIGSKENKDLAKAAALTDEEFLGAGKKVGLEIWRVENRRTAADTPDFGVKRWPVAEYGSFFSGDSYIVLHTYKAKDPASSGEETDKLAWDTHFWLGKDSSQDEMGVAAYKSVELDHILDDGPVQHREVQGAESKLFLSYFPTGIKYMEGGIASGFRAVKPEEYKPRLFQIRRTHGTIRAGEVPVKASSLNRGDVFVLDAGKKIYEFIGESANAFEKLKGGQMVHALVDARMGHSHAVQDLDEEFWSILGGSMQDVQPAIEDDAPGSAASAEAHATAGERFHGMEPEKVALFRLSDASGVLTFKKEKEGRLTKQDLDTNDVFVVDANIQLFVWVGSGSSLSERSQAMKYATEYLKFAGKPATTPVTRIKEGQVHFVFGSLFG